MAALTQTPADSSPLSEKQTTPLEEVTPIAPKVIRTTRQAKDWRPRSTLHLKRFSEMSLAQKICSLALTPETIHELKDEDLDRGPIPGITALADNVWILSHALIPVALQLASYTIFPEYKWPVLLAYPVYLFFFARFMTSTLARLNDQAVKLGTFDEKNCGRDRMPDNAAVQLARAILVTPVLRTAGAFWFYYSKADSPINAFGWSLPLRMGAYMLVIDYFFYAYHRSTHEFDFLWFIHQRHHTTKHPSPILSIIADDYQEILEIAVVPLVATLLVPMKGFHELYLTLCYCVFTEIGGHSGVRTHGGHPLLHYPLRALGMELIIEDHDLHHRNGKSGLSYGKHTQVWDKLFGTKGTRIETAGM